MKRKIGKVVSWILVVVFLICNNNALITNAATGYTINGVTVKYTDFSSSPNECWVYANNIYNKIWGVRFSNAFNDSTNILRNLNDSELTLTADHLKNYVSSATLGSVLRICNSEYLRVNSDGWGHSQIIVQKDSNGFTVLEGGLSASPYCREKYYTWSEYCNTGWLGGAYDYIKYIKCPESSGEITTIPNFTVDLADNQVLRGDSAVITGTVTNGGTYPWLELYMDYAYVSTTANNAYGNYAFYLDTTQYSDGKHLLGVKLRNEDGFDYTAWFNIIINNSGSIVDEYSVDNISNGTILNGNSAPILGRVFKGGTYPWLELYMDYAYVSTTANNSYGNYAFYLDTTKYSDGEHLMGVKMKNEDGYDYTTWFNVIIDNSGPEITNVTVSDVSEDGYTVSCSVSDNNGIDKVLFPTWTNYNEQDDLDQDWRNSDFYKGTINENIVTYRVNTADHNNETGYYITHIYAYDTLGNYTAANAKIAVCTEVYSPTNETIYNGNKYVAFDEKIYTWNQAKTYCESIGGHLVTITSQEEEDIVKDLIKNGSSKGYWLGATDEVNEDNWKWVTGELFDYDDWSNNQPDNSEGNQDYLTIRRLDYMWDDTDNIDINDPTQYGFICEFESIEIPSPTPTVTPTIIPTVEPTVTPTTIPTVGPTVTPTISPTIEPTSTPTAVPSDDPTSTPTDQPMDEEYVVVFVVDDKIIETQNVKYGESAVAPSYVPVKEDDDMYTYSFIGWNTSLESITKDTVITALFSATPKANYTLGDVNQDGEINAADALLVLKYAAKISELNEIEQLAADVTKEKAINASDALEILKYAAKLIDSFD